MTRITIIRDHISIDSNFLKDVFAKVINPTDTLTIIARLVELLIPIELEGRTLEIVATTFLGNSNLISSTGSPGIDGLKGQDGARAAPGSIHYKGGHGSPGGSGTNGGNSGFIRILAEYADGVNIVCRGGDGGHGAVGGSGGAGSDIVLHFRKGSPDMMREQVENTVEAMADGGGKGAVGGDGGAGGWGGSVFFRVCGSGSTPSISVKNGAGGAAGPGDSIDAPNGQLQIDYQGPVIQDFPPWIPPSTAQKSGKAGTPGLAGAEGILTQQVDTPLAEYWSMINESFSDVATPWAEHRLSVGKYSFRCYVPGEPERRDCLQQAVTECQAALSICANLTKDDRVTKIEQEANRVIDNIWAGNNPLSQPLDLEVTPAFDKEMEDFDDTFGVMDTFFKTSLMLLLDTVRRGDVRNALGQEKAQSITRKAYQEREVATLDTEKTGLDSDLARTKNMIKEVNEQIEQAKEDMKRQPMSFGEITGLVIDVAAVVTAIPSGGASLIALAPVAMSLGKEVFTNIPELAKAIFTDEKEGEGTDLIKKIKGESEARKKDIEEVKDAQKAIVNLVETMKKLKASRTPDKSKLISLLEKATELLHQKLLLERQINLNGMRRDTASYVADREGELIQSYEDLITSNSLDENIVRKCALGAVHSAQSLLDTLLGNAFRAARALEIYLLIPQSKSVYYDAGYLHPDVEIAYFENYKSDTDLINAYVESWRLLIKPQSMKDDWNDYFEINKPQISIHPFDFDDLNYPGLLQSFRETRTLEFRIDRDTLPKNRYYTKAQGVYVAFIGAKSTGNIFDYTVTHGPIYTQYISDLATDDLLGRPLSTDDQAGNDELELRPVDTTADDRITNPKKLAFWTRGVMGDYTITLNSQNANFSGLTMIQVWVAYQYVR